MSIRTSGNIKDDVIDYCDNALKVAKNFPETKGLVYEELDEFLSDIENLVLCYRLRMAMKDERQTVPDKE